MTAGYPGGRVIFDTQGCWGGGVREPSGGELSVVVGS